MPWHSIRKVLAAALITAGFALHAGGLEVETGKVCEISLTAEGGYADPYNDVEIDAVFTTPSGATLRVPGFWAGGDSWVVRYASRETGEHAYTVEATNPDDAGLHGVEGSVTVVEGGSDNPLYRHGRVQIADDKHHFEHADGTPFFWLGDTWWMGFSTRLPWPDGFHFLAEDRVEKGFNVIQIVAGPYPDMDEWDPRGASEAGFPFTEEYASINPDYYNLADKKIAYLVDSGLMPCIVGMWGYYYPRLGEERIQRYWRYLVARYSAYPVAWCVACEAAMPYYLSETKEADAELQKAGWNEMTRRLQEIDPFNNMITVHPTNFGRHQITEPGLMDFEMLQTGHGDMDSVPSIIRMMRQSVSAELKMPVINSEGNYEGILGRAWQNVQRLGFYHSVINGAAGYTYGANGIWQFNGEDEPYGPSPHGRSWGNRSWKEASQLAGSQQVGYGGQFWRTIPWWKLERRPEWVAGGSDSDAAYGIACAGVPREIRVVYAPLAWDPPTILQLEDDVAYEARYFNPVGGEEIPLGPVEPNDAGEWTAPLPPEVHDWVLVLEAVE